MTNETLDMNEIAELIRSSESIDEALKRLGFPEKVQPQADFAGFTAKDLEDYIKSELIDNESMEVYWDEMRTVLEDGGYTPWRSERVDIKPFPHGKVRVEDDEETGGEGSQESIYIVLSVTAHVVEDGIGAERKRYFRKQGYYASYDGSNWDGDFHEVWPKQKEITVWVSKKP